MTEPGSRPKLAPHVRLSFDQTRQRYVLQSPEAVTVLNDTGAAANSSNNNSYLVNFP